MAPLGPEQREGGVEETKGNEDGLDDLRRRVAKDLGKLGHFERVMFTRDWLGVWALVLSGSSATPETQAAGPWDGTLPFPGVPGSVTENRSMKSTPSRLPASLSTVWFGP